MNLNLDKLQDTINHICCCEPDIETTVTTFCVKNLDPTLFQEWNSITLNMNSNENQPFVIFGLVLIDLP